MPGDVVGNEVRMDGFEVLFDGVGSCVFRDDVQVVGVVAVIEGGRLF